MSWSPKILFGITVLLTSTSAIAQRIEFDTTGQWSNKAELKTHAVATRGPLHSVSVNLSIPAIDVDEDRHGFDRLHVHGLVPLDRPGQPEIFVTGSVIAVPPGFEPELQVITQKSKTLEGIRIKPTQRRFRCGANQQVGFSFDSKTYEADALFPANVVELQEVGKLQDLRLVRVAINPFQINGANQTLTVTHDIEVLVNLKQVKRAAPIKMSRRIYQIATATAANGAYLGNTVVSMDQEIMLLFVADELTKSIETFVQWKESKGIKVEVVTLTQAGGTKEGIQKYIQDYYDSAAVKPAYLMFVGNKTTLPAFSQSTGSGSAISDYTYALLSGDDAIPDALFGRIIADNAVEAELQMLRAINYEMAPPSGTWYPQGAVIASNEGSNPSDKDYALQVDGFLKGGAYNLVDGFFQGDSNATPENITAAVEAGRSWVAYWGHGSGTAWASTNGHYTNDHVAKLTNQRKLPIIIDVACQNANWARISKPFGKAWVTQTAGRYNAGAVGFYGGSVNISWHPPAVMSVGVAKYHFEKPIYSLGGSVLAGQIYLVEKMGTGDNVVDNLKWYNLFGDPSMQVRTNIPRLIRVQHQVKKVGRDVVVNVNVTTSSGVGIPGALTALSVLNQKGLAVAQTNANGQAKLVIEGVGGLEPKTILTATGYNLYTQRIQLK